MRADRARGNRLASLAAATTILAIVGLGAGPALAQSSSAPLISIPPVIEAEAAGTAALGIEISSADQIPPRSFLRIRGLPRTVALSEGHSIAVGSWAVPIAALSRLRIEVPTGAEGKSDITISLVSVDGEVLGEAKTILLVTTSASTAQALPRTATFGAAASAPSRAQPEEAPARAAGGMQLLPEDRERARKLVQRGNELVAAKDFSAAQHLYRRAADMGLPEGALALARTFDPDELARVGAVGVKPDRDAARKWYERARELGSAEADDFLKRISAR